MYDYRQYWKYFDRKEFQSKDDYSIYKRDRWCNGLVLSFWNELINCTLCIYLVANNKILVDDKWHDQKYILYKILKSAIFDVFVDSRYHIHDEDRFVVNCVLEWWRIIFPKLS